MIFALAVASTINYVERLDCVQMSPNGYKTAQVITSQLVIEHRDDYAFVALTVEGNKPLINRQKIPVLKGEDGIRRLWPAFIKAQDRVVARLWVEQTLSTHQGHNWAFLLSRGGDVTIAGYGENMEAFVSTGICMEAGTR